MKHACKKTSALILALMLLSVSCAVAFAENGIVYSDFALRYEETNGAGDSFVCSPFFDPLTDEKADEAERLNALLDGKAHISQYLQLLSTLQEGGTGLKMKYETSNAEAWHDDLSLWAVPRYVSLLFSVEGKMLSGPPSQMYYPVTLDLFSGKEVSFDQLFIDPDGAKQWIENYLTEEVAPTLSTYLENSDLLPVPYDRFFLDGNGNLILVYENRQLSFLSGSSGAVAFRYSELWDYLDTSAAGIPMQVLFEPYSYTEPDPMMTSLWKSLRAAPMPGEKMKNVLEKLHSTVDSGFYPGGACIEVEEPTLRGALILTDENETTVKGILTSRVDHYGINTGKTTLEEAIALMGEEPLARLPISEAAAEMYRVCPGEAAVYRDEKTGQSFTLYADETGVVQYIRQAAE